MSRKVGFFVYLRSLAQRAPHMSMILLLMILAGAILLAKPSAARDATLAGGLEEGAWQAENTAHFLPEALEEGALHLSGLASPPQFHEFESIATSGAWDWEFFTIGSEHYLALANYRNGSTRNIDSKIYRWDGTHWVEFQSIPTIGAVNWEFFTIGADHYLAVANFHDGSTQNLDSTLYRWDGTRFVQFQSIPTNGAAEWEFFTIGSNHYLAVANYNGPTYDSKIYQWNGTRFSEFQSISTNGAADWRFFTIGQNHYLAVANYYNGSTRNIDSKIYRWDGANFVEFQPIATNGALEWEFFTIGSSHYLVVANHYNDSITNIESKIYQWDGTGFVEFQSIATNGARDWEFFTIGSDHYLAVANYGNDSNHNRDSKIYQWDGTGFVEFQSIPTNGALDWEFFTIGSEHYLAGANSYNDSTYNIDSKLYQFVEVNRSLTGVSDSAVDWGDYDSDGDLDILLTGLTESGAVSKIYRNEEGNLVEESGSGLSAVYFSAVDWGDYDNDNDLDILLTGFTGSERVSKIYRNDDGTFNDIGASLQAVSDGSVAWGDYDNDGDLDLLLTGFDGSAAVSKLYRNDDGTFSDTGAALTAVYHSSAAWGDYDKDGDLDILLTGLASSGAITEIYRNDEGTFQLAGDISLPGVHNSSVAWGDYDADGDLDILLTGFDGSTRLAKVYRNDQASFTDIHANLTAVNFSSVAWGDYDADGDLDILLTGFDGQAQVAKIYRNENGTFTDMQAALTGVASGAVAWGDYNSDGQLDILLTGHDGTSHVAQLYPKHGLSTNTAPNAPLGLISSVSGASATLNWKPANDAQTAAAGLTYNLRVGTTSGGLDIISPMAGTNGSRKVAQLGNMLHNTSWTIENLPSGTYYWSVQAIDNTFAGSAFAVERNFSIVAPTATSTPIATHTPSPTATATPTASPTATSTPKADKTNTPIPGTGDSYEPDDVCQQASTLATDGTVQSHTFHQEDDKDWAQVALIANSTYVLQANSTSANANLVLELYDACDGEVDEFDDNAFGTSTRLIFTARTSGNYYIRTRNQDSAAYGADVTYELSIRTHTPGGVVLIVAGHNDTFELQDNILYAANMAYRTFLQGGVPKSQIRYLSAINDDSRTDVDGDGASEVYASSASANVQEAITTWAANLSNSDTPFYLYLVDHGGVDIFQTHGSSDTITPVELNQWLNTLESASSTPVNVIYEACNAGSFIDGPQDIAKPGRVVIASTGRINNAYPARARGAHFSDAFFTGLGQSQDLYTSFRWGTAAVEATGLWQTPWLDDNGNGVPNETTDGEVARRRGLVNAAFGERPPVVDEVMPPSSIQNGQGIIRANVRDDLGIARVWAVVYPPSFVEPTPSSDGSTPELSLPQVPFSDGDGDGEYVGVYEDFSEDGTYRLILYAEDSNGNISQPAQMEVHMGDWQLYLPILTR